MSQGDRWEPCLRGCGALVHLRFNEPEKWAFRRHKCRKRKLPIGSRCTVPDAEDATANGPRFDATVVKHGRDASGIYTAVRFDDGRVVKYHRSTPKPAAEAR
jgi:hypothetical protein